MLKRFAFVLCTFVFATSAHAQSSVNFSTMSPTVKIKSYRQLFIDDVAYTGSGSGTVISEDGLILTNHHVIFDDAEFEPLEAFEVCITFDVQKEPVCQYMARLMHYDKDLDIALLQLMKEDVFGNPIPSLNYLNYKNASNPKEQTEIRVNGYPGSGGETITTTKGQISGFDEFNGYRYFKTDTDFDHGSSGGTALDGNGNFIGIPTYIRSYAENVGYFLDLKEAYDWIVQATQHYSIKRPQAETSLQKRMKRFRSSNERLSYTQVNYPYLKVDLPKGWEFLEINEDSLFGAQKNLSNPVQFSLQTLPYQFAIDEAYLAQLDKELERVRNAFPDYKKEEISFAGQPSWKISYTSLSNKNVTYYIPYGYVMVILNYSLDLDRLEAQSTTIESVLSSIQFTGTISSSPQLDRVMQFDDPEFTIQSAGDWQFQRNHSKHYSDLLVEGAEKGNFEGSFAIHYSLIPRDQRVLTAKERLSEVVKTFSGEKLVYKNDEVVLGGLKGFLYTYEYEGNEYQEIRKNLVIQLREGAYEFTIEYDDLSTNFDRNLPALKTMLDSFTYKGVNANIDLVNHYGNLGYTFTDIQHHPYAFSIGELASKGIVSGDKEGRFDPEKLTSRYEAIQWIFDSKNHLESEKESKKVIDFSVYSTSNKADRYVAYGQEMGYLNSGDFKGGRSINLAEALKIILSAYEVPLWAFDTHPWYKKYMDKAFELRLVPYGMYDPSKPLTRGELTHLINEIYEQAK